MALPKSTFVMGVLTLGLFGVAIYETAGKKKAAPVEEISDGDEYVRARAEVEREEMEQARREVLAREKQDTNRQVIARSFGAEVAQPGTKWAGLSLVNMGQTFQVDFEDSETCTELGQRLHEAWGRSQSVDVRHEVWANEVTHVRAVLQPEAPCTLEYQSFATPEQWISKSPSSVVPLAQLGGSISKLADSVHGAVDDGVLAWAGQGLGAGTSFTDLSASASGDRITSIEATVVTTTATIDALEAHMTKLLGKPKLEEMGDGTMLTWNRANVRMVRGGPQLVRVTIGKQ